MEINYPHLRAVMHSWAADATQRTVAANVTAESFELFGEKSLLACIVNKDGTADEAAWHNNRQQIFRWLDSDSSRSKKCIAQLYPAILAAMPPMIRAKLVAAKSISYLAVQAQKEHLEAVIAITLGSSPDVIKRECDEAVQALNELRLAAGGW